MKATSSIRTSGRRQTDAPPAGHAAGAGKGRAGRPRPATIQIAMAATASTAQEAVAARQPIAAASGAVQPEVTIVPTLRLEV